MYDCIDPVNVLKQSHFVIHSFFFIYSYSNSFVFSTETTIALARPVCPLRCIRFGNRSGIHGRGDGCFKLLYDYFISLHSAVVCVPYTVQLYSVRNRIFDLSVVHAKHDVYLTDAKRRLPMKRRKI